MTQEQRLDILLEQLKKDVPEYSQLEVENTYEKKYIAVRSLMNIREPHSISSEFLDVQDAFLQEEARRKGIVTLSEIPTYAEQYGLRSKGFEKVAIWQGDITRLAVDGIVNAANSRLLGCRLPMHRCIDNEIHSAAGLQLREACYRYTVEREKTIPGYEEPTGSAMVTSAFNLPSKYVIHTVGPIVGYRLTDALRLDLQNCYQACLNAAMKEGMRSVAFCCISTGEFRFPNEEAAKIAVSTVKEFLEAHEERFDRIIFNVFKDIDREIYERLLLK